MPIDMRFDVLLRSEQTNDPLAVPRASHDTLANHGKHPARYLVVVTPPGFERYFDRLSADLTGTTQPPESHEPYPETIVVGPQIDPNA